MRVQGLGGWSRVARPTLIAAALAVAGTACGGDRSGEFRTVIVSEGRTTLAAQLDRGTELYGEHCAVCHGDAGQGSNAGPPLVGPGALPLEPPVDGAFARVGPFRTAGDVLAFMQRDMPADDPGGLRSEDYLAILALLLHMNEVAMPNRALTADSSRRIEMTDGRVSGLLRWW